MKGFLESGVVRACLLVLAGLSLAAIAAPLLPAADPTAASLEQRLAPPSFMAGGASSHWLGSDDLGRDVLSRLIHGARVSLAVAALAIGGAGAVGVVLGMSAGYLGGWVDRIAMRVVDLALSFPMILLALLLAALFGPSFLNIVLVVILVLWAPFARLARAETLRVKGQDYVLLARSAGLGPMAILQHHILPNILGPILVLATLQVGTVIVLEASLSFLGVGVPPPTPSWGAMIAEGRAYVASAWWLTVFPGCAILLTVLATNLLGDALADWINPLRRRESP